MRESEPKTETGELVRKACELLDTQSPRETLLKQDRDTQAAVVRLAVERLNELEKKLTELWSQQQFPQLTPQQRNYTSNILANQAKMFENAIRNLLPRSLPINDADIIQILTWAKDSSGGAALVLLPVIVKAVKTYGKANPSLNVDVRKACELLIQKLRMYDANPSYRKSADHLQAQLSSEPQYRLESGEAWSDAALADLQSMSGEAKRNCDALLSYCQLKGAGKMPTRWSTEVSSLIDNISIKSIKQHFLHWFPLVDKPRTLREVNGHIYISDWNDLIIPQHVELLRGLVWCCGLREDADLARAVAKLALSAYRKIPGKGPRLVSLGNACITALGMMPGLPAIGQLAILKVKVKFGTAQKEIEKAFNAAAEREKLPRDEIEELAVPSYGLEEVGILRATLACAAGSEEGARSASKGSYAAELLVDGSSAALHWSKGGKPIKSVPAAVKKEHPEEFKELQASLKDINAMLPAQRERIDTLFLAQKTWPLDLWRERYLDHPLIGTIARRLIWSFTSNGKSIDGIWHDGKIVGSDDKPLSLKDDSTVSLWHPIGHPTDEILAWRNWLERHEVVQPFKQAHREVYILTDAERRTGSYSNRFAAHVLKQHQFNALCAARGWKNKLRLMVDDSYQPAHRLLPQWNLRAEYWIEGAGTEYGQDTNETGTYYHITTDQVRFYAINAAQVHAHAGGGGYGGQTDDPLPLDQIPPLVFSEIMRDVDLFVGVASVGNDPSWNDGGPNGTYRDYWQSYSFGDLSASAQTRKALLERLIPRLKIAERCTLADRFLVVKGSIRTYKIHLGSGNILMEPNDQYLCIVPKQAITGHERVFLPFEGDGTLSIILSKAFLLADDAKIKDPTITSQLKK